MSADRFEITLGIDNFIHVKLIVGGKPIEEMRCQLHVDISFCCRHLGRNYDKFGPSDSFCRIWFRYCQSIDTPKGRIFKCNWDHEWTEWLLSINVIFH